MPQDQNGNYVAENALAYSIETNLKRTTLAMSGSLAPTAMPVLEGFVNTVPFWGDLAGDFEDNVEGGTLAFDKLGSGSMSAPIVNVEKGWQQDGIVDAVTMGDRTAITQMVSRVAAFSQRQVNKIALMTAVAGTTGANTATYPTVIRRNETGDIFDHQDIIAGCGLFGERYDEAATIWMHSNVRTHLDQINLVSNTAAYAGQYAPMGTTTNQLAIMVDNALAPTTDAQGNVVYPVIIGAGQFAQYGDGSVARKFAHTFYDDETDADRLSTRQRHSYACYGASFVPVAANRAATLAEIQDPANWTSGFLSKNGEVVDMGAFPFRSVVLYVTLEAFVTP